MPLVNLAELVAMPEVKTVSLIVTGFQLFSKLKVSAEFLCAVCLLQGEAAWRTLLGDLENNLEILQNELLKTCSVYISLNCLSK